MFGRVVGRLGMGEEQVYRVDDEAVGVAGRGHVMRDGVRDNEFS